MQDILDQARGIVDSIHPQELRSICSKQMQGRIDAVNKILSLLDPSDPNFGNLFQALPNEILSRGDGIEALRFIDTNISQGSAYTWKVIENIFLTTLSIRSRYVTANQEELAQDLTRAIRELFVTLLGQETYKNNPSLHILIGTDAEHANDDDSAIESYMVAKGLGSMDAYLKMAAIYTTKQEYDTALSLLREGYAKHQEIAFQHGIIRVLCKSGRLEEADSLYQKVKVQSNMMIDPFLVYKGAIENDEDLATLEEIMMAYRGEGFLEPHKALRELAASAAEYITTAYVQESATIDQLKAIPNTDWSEEQTIIFARSMTRRWYLAQYHIFTLKHPQYLNYYLAEIRQFGTDGTPDNREILYDFYQRHFSEVALKSYQESTGDRDISVENMGLYEMIRVHMGQLGIIFGQGEHYDHHIDQFRPIIIQCLEKEGSRGAIPDDRELFLSMVPLQDESDLFENLPNWVRTSYMVFLADFDKKYGTYYRNIIQGLARDTTLDYERYADLFSRHSDVALLFAVESMLSGNLSDIGKKGDILELIRSYQLDQLAPIDTLLLTAFVAECESGYEQSLDLLMDTPGILDIPEAIALTTECISRLEPKDRAEANKALGQVSRTDYGTGNFAKLISVATKSIVDKPGATIDQFALLHTATAENLLTRGDTAGSLVHLRQATEHETLRSYNRMGDIYELRGETEEAIDCFLKSYTINENLVSIQKLISCCIGTKQFDRAEKYINMAVLAGHRVSGYMLDYHLTRGENGKAIRRMVSIIQDEAGYPVAYPIGTIDALATAIDTTLNNPESFIENSIHSVLGTFIHMRFLADPNQSYASDILQHIDRITALFDRYEGDVLYRCIEESLGYIYQYSVPRDIHLSDSDRIIELIDLHWNNLYDDMKLIEGSLGQSGSPPDHASSSELSNRLIGSILLLLQRLPDSESCLSKWRTRIDFPEIGGYQNPEIEDRESVRYIH